MALHLQMFLYNYSDEIKGLVLGNLGKKQCLVDSRYSEVPNS